MRTCFTAIARFETTAIVVLILLLLCAAQLLVPYAHGVILKGASLYGFWRIDERTSELEQRRETMLNENRILDSLISIHEKSTYTDENSVAATLYERADSAGIRASKIEMGDKKAVDDRFQTPVSIKGTGPYAALGLFCEAVENLPAPARIRLVSAEAAGGKGNIAMFIDFVLLSEQQDKGK